MAAKARASAKAKALGQRGGDGDGYLEDHPTDHNCLVSGVITCYNPLINGITLLRRLTKLTNQDY